MINARRNLLYWSFIGLAAFTIFSCVARIDKNRILVIGITGDTDSINPILTRSLFGNELSELLFLNLMEEQPDFVTFEPELAKSWEVSADKKTYTFHLRTDVYWTDSTEVTADDVLFTFQLQKNKDIGWSGGSSKDYIAEVKKLDDSTVVFIFNRVYLYQLMDINEGVILPEHILNHLTPEEIKSAPFSQMLVSDGPYRLKSWIPNQYLELEANKLFYDSSVPNIKSIVFKIVPDKYQLLDQLKTGEVHFVEGIAPKEIASSDDNDSGIVFQHFPYLQYVQIFWNMKKPLFQDVRIRKAMTLAIDRQALVDFLLAGYGQVCRGPIHPQLWAYNPNVEDVRYDAEEAKALLRDCGWKDRDNNDYLEKDGQDLSFTLMTNIGSETKEDAQVMIQEMLKKIGVKVVIQRFEWSVFVDRVVARDFDAVLMSMMSATKVDLFPAWHSSMSGPDGFNLSCYSNPEVDRLLETARALADQEEAKKLWYRFQDIISRDVPGTFLWVPERVVGLDKRIRNVRFSPASAYFNLPEWSFE
jgi:peptide/nickel transport system substrate-binding protein